MGSLNVSGIDEHRTGLPCRGALGCAAVFSVPAHCTLEVLLLVGRDRDAHERDAHAYVHVAIPFATWGYDSTVKHLGNSRRKPH